MCPALRKKPFISCISGTSADNGVYSGSRKPIPVCSCIVLSLPVSSQLVSLSKFREGVSPKWLTVEKGFLEKNAGTRQVSRHGVNKAIFGKGQGY